MGKCNASSMVPGVRMFSTWSFPIPSPECGEPSHDKPRPSLPTQEKLILETFHLLSLSVPLRLVVQSLSRVQLCAAWIAAHQASCPSPSPGVCSNSCPLHWWCHPTISSFVPPSPPALNLSQHWVFSNELSLHIRWPKYWRVRISPSNEYSGLSSFRFDWFDLAVQETLQSLLQHHSFHIHTWLLEKNVALTIQTFVGKVISLLFNTLSRFVIIFLPRSKRLLISWLQSPSAVILEPQKIKSVTVSTFPHLFAMKCWAWMPWSWFFECWVLSQLLVFFFLGGGVVVLLFVYQNFVFLCKM